jgi:aspartyl-tRNA(Asn)/glutamyl-tRNA(Gln) amidotransferase subunit A
MSLARLARRLRAGELTPLEAVDRALDASARRDGAFNAFISVRGRGGARRGAGTGADPGGRRGPLHGVPVAVKDVIDVAGTRTTANSAVFDDRRRPSATRPSWRGLRRPEP